MYKISTIKFNEFPTLAKGYWDDGPFYKYLNELADKGGYAERSVILGSEQACLINDINPDNNKVPKSLQLNEIYLLPNHKGTYWGMRLYNTALVMRNSVVSLMYGKESKPEGHAIYTNPSVLQVVTGCLITQCAGNGIQSANRPWEAGGKMFPCLYWEASYNKFLENHPIYSDRGGFLISIYGLAEKCVQLIEHNEIFETNAIIEKSGETYGSIGAFCSYPVNEPPATWTGVSGWWTPGQYTGELLRIADNKIVMKKPSQEILWTHGNKRVEFVNNNLNFLGQLGNAKIHIDPPGSSVTNTGSFLIAGNTGEAIPVYHKGQLIGNTSQTIKYN